MGAYRGPTGFYKDPMGAIWERCGGPTGASWEPKGTLKGLYGGLWGG